MLKIYGLFILVVEIPDEAGEDATTPEEE